MTQMVEAFRLYNTIRPHETLAQSSATSLTLTHDDQDRVGVGFDAAGLAQV
jgi:hypothetical protein